MGKSVTTASTLTHYEIQKRRRQKLVEEHRAHRVAVVQRADVQLQEDPVRRMRRGVYIGPDGTHPTKVLDATMHEIAPQTISTVHRHSWDAIMFVTKGSGWTEIDGQRIRFRPWDTLHLPGWSWHRHGNDSDADLQFVTWSVEPMYEAFGVALIEEAGDEPYQALPGPPRAATPSLGDDPYARRVRRLAQQAPGAQDRRLITRWDDVVPRLTKRGARSSFLVDESIGYRTAGLSAVLHELAPGLWQSRHRHGGEAWLHVVSGHGHSDVDGTPHEWGPGDLVVVDHWAWHQHFNDDESRSARLIRVHNFDSLYDMMRVLLDPLNIFEEPAVLDAPPNLADIVWPALSEDRPE